MTAPAGAIVGLYVDLCADVGTGDVIETQSGRQHLRCIVDPDAAPDDHVYAGVDGEVRAGVVHVIRWYVRRRRA